MMKKSLDQNELVQAFALLVWWILKNVLMNAY
jgi:hypothetical protein